MSTNFRNVYEDQTRAEAYANLEFPATYYLAFRDLPAMILQHAHGRRALDFGCGAGRSTRFLKELGFETIGVDISEQMIARARERDPEGDYRLIANDDLNTLGSHSFDLILSAFTFDNIPGEKKIALFQSFRALLTSSGCIVNLVSAPEIYTHEWTSFSTKDFPQNRFAQSGDKILIVMLDVEDQRPVEDIFWKDEDYIEVYRRSGLNLVHKHRPLGKETEPFAWVSETKVSPWVIYVLKS